MAAKKKYTVQRVGNGRALSATHDSLRGAFMAIGYSIVDNGYGTKKEAQQFTARMSIDGTPAVYGPYTFTITPVQP